MSTAHRPTWNPTEGRADVRHMSRRVAAQELPSHTKLKFRQPQQGGPSAGSTSTAALAGRSEQHRRDLKRELEAAERANRNKKRRAQGLAPEDEQAEHDDEGRDEDGAVARQAIEGASPSGKVANEQGSLDDEGLERRRMIAQLQELDRDESDSEDDGNSDAGSAGSAKAKGKGKATANGEVDRDTDDSSDSEDEDDDEDETAALLRELEKIKRERAEERERQERERAEMQQASREEEIALGNPLLNLENALKNGRGGSTGSGGGGGGGGGSFGIKRRWDDDVVFKNQASGGDAGDKSGFINDLTRSEFHKRFMQRYVK